MKGVLPARRDGVHVPGDEALSRSRFSFEEYGSVVERSEPFHLPKHGAEGTAAARERWCRGRSRELTVTIVPPAGRLVC